MKQCIVVNNNSELLSALEIKPTSILVTSSFKEEEAFLDKTELPLSEMEQMGFAVGSGGSTMLAGGIIYAVLNKLGKEDKQQKKINSKMQNYVLTRHDEDLLLQLRQQFY